MFFHILFFRNIGFGQLKPVVGAREWLNFPIVLMNRLYKYESAVFLYCRFSIFLKVPFSDYQEVATAVVVSFWSW